MAITNPQDDYVQVAPDSTGKKIDNAVLTRDDGTIIERQRVAVASDSNPRLQAELGGEAGRGALYVGGDAIELLNEINHTLKMLLAVVAAQAGEDLDQVREFVAMNEIG